jgi:hypothetical protein
MQILLAATVLFAVAWLVALRPKPSAAGGGGAGPSASARHGAVATGAATRATPVVAARAHRRAPAPAHHRADPALARHVAAVRAALRHHRAIAIAFVDPAAADSRALASELARVSRFGGRALTLSVPIGQLASFGAITREVHVTTAPTTVIVARGGSATTIVGFADRFEIQQRLADAAAR